MFMIRLGSFFAWALIALGGIRVVLGLLIAFGTDPGDNTEAAQILLASANTGEAIDEGFLAILAGIVVGLLTTIAKNTTKRRDEE